MYSITTSASLAIGLLSLVAGTTARIYVPNSLSPPRFNPVGLQQRDILERDILDIYARSLDLDVDTFEELLAARGLGSTVKKWGQKATKYVGKTANALGKAANLGKEVFGRRDEGEWEDGHAALQIRYAEPEAEVWVGSGEFFDQW